MPYDPPEASGGEDPIGFIRTPTQRLRDVMDEQKRILSPEDFAEMTGQIRALFDKFTRALLAVPRGPERGRALHRMMDAAVDTAPSVQVSCRYGCCGCCHTEVEILDDEAALLRERVLAGVAIDGARLELQAGREPRSPEWERFWSAENRCVFLGGEGKTGACRVYEDRPSVCRRLLVTTPPEACTTAGAPVAPLRILLAEIVLSAATSADQNGAASLSKKLLGAGSLKQ